MDIEHAFGTYLKGHSGAVVAYSGGVDSTVLLNIVSRLFPEKHVGVFVDSPLLSGRQRDSALRIAKEINANVIIVKLSWNDLSDVMRNDEGRCYHCKRAIYSAVQDVANDFDIDICLDGENASDDHAGRPGRKAAEEFSIRSPFCDLGISRNDVVSYLKGMNLTETLVKDTCMATRIPTGTSFSEKELRLVEKCERLVRDISRVEQLRVRIHGNQARILTSPEEITLLDEAEGQLCSEFSKLGFIAEIDRNGYRE